MHRHKKFIIIATIIISSIISGCAERNFFQHKSSSGDLDSLIADQEYDMALQYLLNAPLSQTLSVNDRENLRIKILALISEYESDIKKNAADLAADDDLSAALSVTNNALGKIPSSIELKILRARIETQIIDQLKNKERELLFTRARHALLQLELYGEQARLQKDHENSSQINDLEKMLAAMHWELVECAKETIRNEDLATAKECLHLATIINPTKDVENLQAILKDKISLPTKKEAGVGKKSSPVTNKEPDQQKLTESLTAEIENALAQKDLLAAKSILDRLQNLKKESDEVIVLRQRIEQATTEQIQALFKQGNELYRNGSIAEAREVWLNVLLIDPDNQQAATHVKRAEKVLERLRELKENNAGPK
ncbi:MAG: hypothetical protein KKB30_07860 [Proteobacteria bacterium]|nr:hypothetical protein [Pseudomonadota bacterium]MBU1714733.1 hypothetical protein [Pseudomonadota bacterium]